MLGHQDYVVDAEKDLHRWEPNAISVTRRVFMDRPHIYMLIGSILGIIGAIVLAFYYMNNTLLTGICSLVVFFLGAVFCLLGVLDEFS